MTPQQYLQLQFDTLLEYSTHGIWILDGKGVVLKVNPAGERLIGVTAQDVIGKNIAHLAEEEVIDQALTPHVLKAGHPVTKLLYVLKTEKYILKHAVVMSENNILDEIIPEMANNEEGHTPEWSPLSEGEVPSLAEQLNIFEKSILEHAIKQYKTTRKMAEFLKTSQSRIARMLKKHQLSTRS